MLNDYHTKPTDCPYCGKQHDMAMELERHHAPVEKDFSICAYCTVVSRFGPGMQLHKLTPEDEADITPEMWRVIARAQDAIRLAKRKSESTLRN